MKSKVLCKQNGTVNSVWKIAKNQDINTNNIVFYGGRCVCVRMRAWVRERIQTPHIKQARVHQVTLMELMMLLDWKLANL